MGRDRHKIHTHVLRKQKFLHPYMMYKLSDFGATQHAPKGIKIKYKYNPLFKFTLL